ncbi:MAG: amidohydrolase [Candidatus Nitronauta litoralis]|uniref:Amidohydrolase n=1 Tax=Candidatus Nitronauta litoralis TaxID=2705533 RepID=A0A7T0BTZ7_9BACT|nr:MAG: amidohydrolase [Candidatus Nitronauta litoralis]
MSTLLQLFFLGITLLASTVATVWAGNTTPDPVLLKAARIFDGQDFLSDNSVLIENGKISKTGINVAAPSSNTKILDLGDATILPGFIELHAHLLYRKVQADKVLKHGITTVRDLGGPLHQPYGGKGSLRVLTAGPIITAPHGYPIPLMGAKNIAVAVSNEEEARKTVRDLVAGGAVIIKIALEPGGETGAPWSTHHHHGHHGHSTGKHSRQHTLDQGHSTGKHARQHTLDQGHSTDKHARQHTLDHGHASHSTGNHSQGWPLLSESIVKTIVDEAHKNGRRVTAHLAEERGAQIAINSGVDEWAHMPCNTIPETLLKLAASQRVKIVSTLDTLSKCSGIVSNTKKWKELGGEILYGAEIAHPDIPWGIDAQELLYLQQLAKMNSLDIFRMVTSKAGKHLEIPMLGTLQTGAMADIIAVKGNPIHNLKILEYPDLVISGGEIVINQFSDH